MDQPRARRLSRAALFGTTARRAAGFQLPRLSSGADRDVIFPHLLMNIV